jgi:hypothetical protein
VGVTWELVGLETGQMVVKWNATGEWWALARVRGWVGDMGRSGQIGGGGKRGVLM